MNNKISVLIPAFNAEATLEMALLSVMNQTRPADEIIVLDDGSTDGTAAIASRFGPQVALHGQQNAGVATARNVLLRLAKHNFVAFLDSDDVWHPCYLQQQCRAIERCPDAAAYYSKFQTVRRIEDWYPDANAMANAQCRSIEPEAILRRYLKASGFLLPSFSVVRKDALLGTLGEDLFPADISTAEDVYMWYGLALAGPFVESAPQLGAYRLTAGSLSSNRLITYERRVAALKYMAKVYEREAPADLKRLLVQALVLAYRKYAKHLMGAGDIVGARRVLKAAWRAQRDWRTLAVFASTHFPALLQPSWPEIERVYVDKGS